MPVTLFSGDIFLGLPHCEKHECRPPETAVKAQQAAGRISPPPMSQRGGLQ